jgi:hypothetical protein
MATFCGLPENSKYVFKQQTDGHMHVCVEIARIDKSYTMKWKISLNALKNAELDSIFHA